MSALNSAMKLSPGPGLKNDASYALAEANVRLPEALQYAKDAVEEEETASRDVHLNKLDVFALEHTRHISAYWDTLGWVYFKMSKLPEAESYLFAAWQLSQDSTVADHLGQTYEQEHKTSDAIHMYRLALSINSHLPDTQERLSHLIPVKTKSEVSLSAGAELSQLRSTKLPRLVPGTASAEFFLLFAPGPKVQDVLFIRGSEELRTKSNALTTTAFKIPFPNGSDARILRRAILGCYPSTGCSLVMLPPRTVQSTH